MLRGKPAYKKGQGSKNEGVFVAYYTHVIRSFNGSKVVRKAQG